MKEPRKELAEYIRLGGFPATHLQRYSEDEIYTIVRGNACKFIWDNFK